MRRAVASFASKRLHYQILFLAFQCITLALVLFLMYVPELLTWWPSILGHYPNDFIWLVESVTNTRVFGKESKISDSVEGNNSVFCSLCQVSPPNWIIKYCTTTCVIITVSTVSKNLGACRECKVGIQNCEMQLCVRGLYIWRVQLQNTLQMYSQSAILILSKLCKVYKIFDIQ